MLMTILISAFLTVGYPPEFNNAGCLLISEVKFLLEHADDTRDPPDNAYVQL